jgi:hypothetical protein
MLHHPSGMDVKLTARKEERKSLLGGDPPAVLVRDHGTAVALRGPGFGIGAQLGIGEGRWPKP